MRVPRMGVEILALALVACSDRVRPHAELKVAVDPDPVVAVWAPNMPKFPHEFVPGVHLQAWNNFGVVIEETGGVGAALDTVVISQGGGTGYSYYYGRVRVPPRGRVMVTGFGSVLYPGPFAVEVRLVDDDGQEHRLHATSEVVPPPS